LTNECVVVNSSVVIALAEINLLNILVSLYEEVIVPRAVYKEVVVKGRGKPGSQELEVLVQRNRARLLAPRYSAVVKALHDPLGLGEAEAIAVALEQNCMVALDDRIARSKARTMGLKIIGTLGLLRKAYDKGLIGKNTLTQALQQLKQHGFRISDNIMREVIGKLNQ